MFHVQIMTVMGDCHVHCRELAMIGRIIYFLDSRLRNLNNLRVTPGHLRRG